MTQPPHDSGDREPGGQRPGEQGGGEPPPQPLPPSQAKPGGEPPYGRDPYGGWQQGQQGQQQGQGQADPGQGGWNQGGYGGEQQQPPQYGAYGEQQPPYGNPYYGQQPPYGSGPGGGTNTLSIWSLIAGIVGLFTCGVISLAAVIIGHMSLRQIAATGQRGRGMALTGLILGYVALVGWIIYWIVSLIFVGTGHHGRGY
ncbi:DUF4190 domain-containing protein [Actinomadura atramentaria]|uniref:DUF4190 domain-containing protein n=1 Tax=Actinomadura atramentaria TaxID=1990 RepID=UPI000379D2D2|nr:DUF4190 domain-containing protein [Actinomadura atramentaria]